MGDNVTRFERIYEAHYNAVYTYCRRRIAEADARDLTAEVFATAWKRLIHVPKEPSTLPWLFGTAHRKLMHHWRGSQRRTRLAERLRDNVAATQRSPELQVVKRAEFELVTKAAGELAPLDREVLRLALWEELPHADIAAVVGSTTAAVKQRLHRARKKLAAEFVRLGGTVGGSSEGEMP